MSDLYILRVLPPIEFDRQLRLMTIEVEDIGTQRMLTTKTKSEKLIPAQKLPEKIFGIG